MSVIYGSLLCIVGGCTNKRMPHKHTGQLFPRCRKHQKLHDAALNAAMEKLARDDQDYRAAQA